MSEGLRPQEAQARKELNNQVHESTKTGGHRIEPSHERRKSRRRKSRTVRHDPEGLQAEHKVDLIIITTM